MTSDAQARSQSVFDALKALGATPLRQAAVAQQGSIATLLEQLADEVEKGERTPAFDALLEPLSDLDPTTATAGGIVNLLVGGALLREQRRGMELATELAERVEAVRANAEEASGQAVAALAGDDAPLAELLDQALGMLSSVGQTTRSATAAIKESEGLAADLGKMLEGAAAGEPVSSELQADLQRRLKRLERQAERLEGSSEHLNELIDVFERVRDLTSEREHPAAAEMALFYAALLQDAEAESQRIVDGWRRAYETGLEHSYLAVVRMAGQRVQLHAIHSGDLITVAQVSEKIAELAQQQGDRRAYVFATVESIQLDAQRALTQASARARAEAFLEEARATGDSVDLVARIQLTLAEVCATIGDQTSARSHLRTVLGTALKHGQMPREQARSAYLLAMLEAEHQPKLSIKHFKLAAETARGMGEWPLYAVSVLRLLGALGPKAASETRWLAETQAIAKTQKARAWPDFCEQLEQFWGAEATKDALGRLS